MALDNTDTTKKAVIPTITGYPLLDTMLRIALTTASAGITAFIVGHLQAHGFTDPNLSIEIGTAVFATLIGAATVAWSLVQTQLNKLEVTKQVISAAATGQISDAVKAAAVKAQSISEEDITKALNNAETIKGQQ